MTQIETPLGKGDSLLFAISGKSRVGQASSQILPTDSHCLAFAQQHYSHQPKHHFIATVFQLGTYRGCTIPKSI